jgi:hypothetical protein
MLWFVWLKSGVCDLLVDGQGNFGSVMEIVQQPCVTPKPECVRFRRDHGDIEKRDR